MYPMVFLVFFIKLSNSIRLLEDEEFEMLFREVEEEVLLSIPRDRTPLERRIYDLPNRFDFIVATGLNLVTGKKEKN